MNNREKNTYAVEQIINATIELLRAKRIENIKIIEITEKAMVSRATFYRNFSSVRDVVVRKLKIIYNAVLIEYNYSRKIDDLLMILMKFCLGNKDFFLALYNNHLGGLLMDLFINDNIKDKNMTSSLDIYHLYSLIYGIYGWIHSWIIGGMKETPEELYLLYQNTKEHK